MKLLDLSCRIEDIENAQIIAGGAVCFISATEPLYGKFAVTPEELYFFFDEAADESVPLEFRQQRLLPKCIKIADIATINKGISFLKPFTIVEKDGTKTKFGTWKKKDLFALLGK